MEEKQFASILVSYPFVHRTHTQMHTHTHTHRYKNCIVHHEGSSRKVNKQTKKKKTFHQILRVLRQRGQPNTRPSVQLPSLIIYLFLFITFQYPEFRLKQYTPVIQINCWGRCLLPGSQMSHFFYLLSASFFSWIVSMKNNESLQ